MVNATPTLKVTHRGSLPGLGSRSGKATVAAIPMTPAATTCQATRRVARDTEESTPAPEAVIETTPATLVTSAIGSGQRRRKNESPRARIPTPRSSQNSGLASRHWSAAVAGQSAPLMTMAATVRHACDRQVSGGLYCSGVGSCTGPA